MVVGSRAQSDGAFLLQGGISNILEELVVQPLLVSVSALTLATETVRSILKIDDVVSSVCITFLLINARIGGNTDDTISCFYHLVI